MSTYAADEYFVARHLSRVLTGNECPNERVTCDSSENMKANACREQYVHEIQGKK